MRHPPPRFLLSRSLRLCPRRTRAAAPPSFRLPQPRRLNSIPSAAARARYQGRAACFLLPSPGPPWSVQLGARRGQQALAGGGSGRAKGRRRRRRREGRCCPAQAPQASAGVSSGLRTLRKEGEGVATLEPGIPDSARSRGLGLAEGPRAGGRRSFGAGGRPPPRL